MDHRKIDAQSPTAITTVRKYVRQELLGLLLGLVLLVALWFYLADEIPSARTLLHVGIAFFVGGVGGALLVVERWLTYLLQRTTAAHETTSATEPTTSPPAE
jgi:hypothetical protein